MGILTSFMRQRFCLSSILLALILTAGCRHRSQLEMLVEAEAFLPAEPDSADARLKMVNTRLLEGNDEESAYYALLRTMTDAMQGTAPLNDTLVQRAYTFYRQKSNHGASPDHSLVRYYAQSALYMGDWYAAQDSTKRSEDCYRQAIKYSEKAEDWHTCYIAYEKLAEQMQWSNVEEALKLIIRAIDIYEKCNDSLGNLLSLYHCRAHYTFQIENVKKSGFERAISLTQEEYDLAKKQELIDYENQALSLLALIYWTIGEYQTALRYAKKITLLSIQTEYEIAYNRIIAQCYLSCDSLIQAKATLQRLPSSMAKKESYLYARALAEISILYDEKDSAVFYVDSAFNSAEGMFMDALQAKDDYYKDNLKKEKQNEQLIYKDKLKTWLFGGAICMILISSLLMGRVLLLRIRMHREQRRNSILQRKYELERNIEEKHRTEREMQLLQEKQQALEERNQKKTAAIKYLQRYIIERTDVAMKLKDGTTHVKMSSKEWIDIERLLDEIDDRRISKIRARFKDLSIDDIRLCVMVRIGMSNPAIGNVYGITPSAVQHRKLTLKKKGFGVDNPDVTLDDFIESI